MVILPLGLHGHYVTSHVEQADRQGPDNVRCHLMVEKNVQEKQQILLHA